MTRCSCLRARAAAAASKVPAHRCVSFAAPAHERRLLPRVRARGEGCLRAAPAPGLCFPVFRAGRIERGQPADRLDAGLGVLDPTVVGRAHAWADDDDDDILGDVWRRAASFAGAAVGLEEFSAVTWVRRAPDL